jgi:23S rRNA G2445 N2-methylase RlmL
VAASWNALGEFLRRECEDAVAWVLCGNADLARHLGLRALVKMPVKNGAIDSRWLCYDLASAGE